MKNHGLLFALALLAPGWLWGGPTDTWHWRNPLPQGNSLQNAQFVNHSWVAVGELGTILTSSNGADWTTQETGLTTDLRSCAYGAGQFVVVGDLGTVVTSADGVVWTPQYAGTFYSLDAVLYTNSQFVAVGENSTILTSADGVSWTQRCSGDWELLDIKYIGGSYIAAGGQPFASVVLTSPDARDWTPSFLGTGGGFSNIAYAAGRFAATTGNFQYSGGYVWTSEDAVHWTPGTSPRPNDTTGIYYARGMWILAAGTSYATYYGTGELLVSPDLTNWTSVASSATPISGLAEGNGLIIASCDDGTFLSSTDAVHWTNSNSALLPTGVDVLEYLNGAFVAVGENQIAFSSDGATWTNLINLTNTDYFTSITYGAGRYVAGSQSRTVYTSVDGINWTNPAPQLDISPYVANVAVTYGNGLFVGAAGYEADILTSPDGLNWSVRQLDTNGDSIYFYDITYGGGRFVAVGGSAIATSRDGTNWFYQNTNETVYAVAYGNGAYVAVGPSGIITSTDATNWTAQLSADVARVGFGGGIFVADGEAYRFPGFDTEAPIWTSPDGFHWSQQHSHTARDLGIVAYGDGAFLLVGDASAILQSDPFVNLELSVRGGPQLRIDGPISRNYRLEYADSVGPATPWNFLTNYFAATNEAAILAPAATNGSSRFYRAILLP